MQVFSVPVEEQRLQETSEQQFGERGRVQTRICLDIMARTGTRTDIWSFNVCIKMKPIDCPHHVQPPDKVCVVCYNWPEVDHVLINYLLSAMIVVGSVILFFFCRLHH